MVMKVVLACFVLVSAGSALALQRDDKIKSDIDAAANASHLDNNWIPTSCIRFAGVGSYWGEPTRILKVQDIYAGPDCKLNNGRTSASLGNSGGCGGPALTDTEWLAYDLGYTRYIESVRFLPSHSQPGYYACPTYRVLTSDSAPAAGRFIAQASVGYTTIVDQSTAVDYTQEQTHSIGVSARYIMFDCVTSTAHSGGLRNFNVKADGDDTACDPDAPLPTGPASATGDPHLQNIHGERFDLMKPGKHVLINIPRGKGADSAMLRVQADAVRLGKNCGDLYFQQLNVTGSWAEAKQAGGYHYSVSQRDAPSSKWVAFGKVSLKVVIAHTDRYVQYLNVYVKHLGQSGFAVGGLLGEDDHEEASTPPEACLKRMSLKKDAQSIFSRHPAASIAAASLT
jgi:hypothetical protein